MNEIIELLNNYQTYTKDVSNYDILKPIKFYKNYSTRANPEISEYESLKLMLIILPPLCFLFSLYLIVLYGFDLKEFLIYGVAFPLGFFIFFKILLPLVDAEIVLDYNKKILEVCGTPINFDEVTEITFYEEGNFFKKVFMQVKYSKTYSIALATTELEINSLLKSRNLILLLKFTFKDKVKYKL